MALAGVVSASAQTACPNPHGLHRDPCEVRLFRRLHPCPATGRTTGACPGWVVDHMIALCEGGPDRPSNMHWQTKADAAAKDKWECKP